MENLKIKKNIDRANLTYSGKRVKKAMKVVAGLILASVIISAAIVGPAIGAVLLSPGFLGIVVGGIALCPVIELINNPVQRMIGKHNLRKAAEELNFESGSREHNVDVNALKEAIVIEDKAVDDRTVGSSTKRTKTEQDYIVIKSRKGTVVAAKEFSEVSGNKYVLMLPKKKKTKTQWLSGTELNEMVKSDSDFKSAVKAKRI